jgi:uncharacterized protein
MRGEKLASVHGEISKEIVRATLTARRPLLRMPRAMDLQRIVRWFLPKEDEFYILLERHSTVAKRAADALAQFKNGRTAEQVRNDLAQLEHEADSIFEQFEEALARTFVTPIDREDLHKLSSELDDIVDYAYAAALACALFGVERPTQPMLELMTTLTQATEIVAAALPKLRNHEYTDVANQVKAIRGIERDGDIIYRAALSKLFGDSAVDAKALLREREVLGHLENAIDHCNHVANTLANLAVKHG